VHTLSEKKYEEIHNLIIHIRDGGSVKGMNIDKVYEALVHLMTCYDGGSVRMYIGLTDKIRHNTLLSRYLTEFGCKIEIGSDGIRPNDGVDWMLNFDANQELSSMYKPHCKGKAQLRQLEFSLNGDGIDIQEKII